MTLSEAFDFIDTHFADLQDKIVLGQADLSHLDERVRQDEIALAEIGQLTKKAQEAHDVEIKRLMEEMAPVRVELRRLKEENQVLVDKKSELLTENVRINQQTDKFRKYEIEARKVLQATETSLMEREKAVLQRESLKPINRSILPAES